MSDDSKEWRWVGEDGAQKTLSEQELIAELSSEALAHYTLVWRKGWAEWLPAMQVAELAWALPPGKADDPSPPKERATANAPPPPPLYRYPVIKRRAQNLKSDKPPPERPKKAPRPTGPASEPKKTGPRPAAAAAPPKETAAAPSPAPERSPEPVAAPEPDRALEPVTEASEPTQPRALDESAAPLDSDDFLSRPSDVEATVEPDDEIHEVDAELEDSRPFATADVQQVHAAAAYAYGDEDNAETRVLPGRALPTGEATYVAPHAPPAAEDPALSAHPPPMEASPTTDPPLGDDAMADLPRLPPPPPAPAGFSEYAQAPRRGPPTYVYALVAVIVVLGLSVVFMAGESNDTGEGTALPTPSVASAPATTESDTESQHAKTALPCVVTRAGVQLKPTASPGVQPTFARVPGSGRLAVGFADGKEAYGMTLDPMTLDRDQVFQQRGRSDVVTATPTTESDKLGFSVVRAKDDVSPAAVIDASPPFILGRHGRAIVRVPANAPDSEPTAIWSDIQGDITAPRVAVVEGTGHVVTFRAGGKDGKVFTGWTTRDGSKLSQLTPIETDAEFLGTPDVGGNEDGALVAYAARKQGASEWSLQTARVERGGAPARAIWFEIPRGGPGGNAISPLVAGLSGKRWLIAWTEGSAGGRAVRLQVLDSAGAPVGPATRVSPESTNAGQGALWVRGRDAVVFFFVEGAHQHELWAAAVQCPNPS